MKNKYLKGAHISERKMSELLELFSRDLTATQIAALIGVSRITTNAYFKLLRKHIATFCEQKNPLDSKHDPIEEPTKAVSAGKGILRKCLYGISISQDFVYTRRLPHAEYDLVYECLKKEPEADHPVIRNFNLQVYRGIVDFNTFSLFPLKHKRHESTTFGFAENQPEEFWRMLKSRIIKFRGLNSSTLYLHVKETEFRYNYRNEDIYGLLLGIIQSKPLHLSRA